MFKLLIAERPSWILQKPLKFLLRLVAGVFTIREVAEFLEIALEAHAEHEHIAPGWLGKCICSSSLAAPNCQIRLSAWLCSLTQCPKAGIITRLSGVLPQGSALLSRWIDMHAITLSSSRLLLHRCSRVTSSWCMVDACSGCAQQGNGWAGQCCPSCPGGHRGGPHHLRVGRTTASMLIMRQMRKHPT